MKSSNDRNVNKTENEKKKIHALCNCVTRKKWEQKIRESERVREIRVLSSLSPSLSHQHAAHLLNLHNVHLHFWIFYAGLLFHIHLFFVTLLKSSLARCRFHPSNIHAYRSAFRRMVEKKQRMLTKIYCTMRKEERNLFSFTALVCWCQQGAIGSKYLIDTGGNPPWL